MKQLSVLLILTIFSYQLIGQCTGSLGENIFLDGDFGSGSPNILLPDPQIAPGYTYEPNPPPIDGTYTITNNTTNWGSFANPNWANISDNSSDPNGYMMIVNASYDPGLFYEQVVNDLCENSLYVFSVDIYNLAGGIQPNVTFLLDGVSLFNTGNIPLNAQWNTYETSFTTGPGQNSITLALQNNAPGGNGNDLALDNITFRACGPEALISPAGVSTPCSGTSELELEALINGNQYSDPQIQWQESLDGGVTWVDIPAANDFTYTHTNFTDGVYYYRYYLANTMANLFNNKCRIISEVKIIEVVPQIYTIIDTICAGLNYVVGNSTYDSSGNYTDSLTSANGCDSVINLNLEVIPDPNIEVIFSAIDPNCDDSQDGSIAIENINNAVAPYTIEIDGEVDDDGSIFNLGGGSYNYLISDKYGCTFEETINLINPPSFNIDIGENIIVELGESVEIIPEYSISPESYVWSVPFDCDDDCETQNWTPPNSTQVILNATTENGCTAQDSLYINVIKVRKVFIPNAFSPNSDGYNDYFNIYASSPNVQQIDELTIFNRWGGIVHQRKNFPPNEIGAGWAGDTNGKRLEGEVYVYLAKIRFLDGEVIIYSGDVTMIK